MTEPGPPLTIAARASPICTPNKVKGLGSMVGGWYGVSPVSTSEDYLASARSHAAFELRPTA